MRIKILKSVCLLFVAFLLACSSKQELSTSFILKENHMDFPTYKKITYKAVQLKIPIYFKRTKHKKSYVLQKNAACYSIKDLHMDFSIEAFDQKEAQTFQANFDTDINPVNAVHDSYITKRQNSLAKAYSSIKKYVPSLEKENGIIQTIIGDKNDDGIMSTYHTITFQKGKLIYVIQLIGKRENMVYLYDDLQDILKSIK